jgi:ketosteroid isomerase-like protein
MFRRTFLATAIVAGLFGATPALAQQMDDASQKSFDVVMSFMNAMGSGDMATVTSLLADDVVWQNEGNKDIPWIGPWNGKEEFLTNLGRFGGGFQTTEWKNEDAFALGDTVAVFGRMNGITKASGSEIGEFTFGLRAKVKDGKIVLWNWLENSYAVSNAFQGK